MRLLTLTKLRRPRPSPLPPLHRFFSHYSSSFSSPHSLLTTSIHRNENRNQHPGCSANIYWHSPHHSRQFSTEPSASESNGPFLPLQFVTSLLDHYHDATGFPWWITISSATVAMRLALLPVTVVQLKKLKMIAEVLDKLPPPFPPPLSGRSFKDQFALFWKEKRAAGGPSLFWFFIPYVVQIPCFLLGVASVRRMALDHHPGFDIGGTLWFQNLTEHPHGVLGLIFPFCIAGLHLTNIQLSLRKSSLKELRGSLGLLAKAYRAYLQLLTLPILITTFNIPQASLVYWLTNSTLTMIQILGLRHPKVVKFLGLPEMKASAVGKTVEERGSIGVGETVKERGSVGTGDVIILTPEGEISARSLSPDELVLYSIKTLPSGLVDRAMAILRIALEKDPGHVRASVMMGQMLYRTNQHAEAVEYFENAISKLLVDGNPTDIEKVDLLILASKLAGITFAKQGKIEEGLVHFERIGQVEEPENPISKAQYYECLLLLSSALCNVGRKDEALKYLEKLVAYNPACSVYLEQLKDEPKDFGTDLSDKGRYL